MANLDWLPATLGVGGVERKLKAGQVLFHIGDRTRGFYEILTGRVRLVRIDCNGREAVLHTAAAGDTIAEASLFAKTYHCDAVATTAAAVRLYPKAAVLAAFQRDPKIARTFTAMLAQQVMSLRARLQQRDIRSARERVRHYLTVNAGTDGRTVALAGTIKELAGELGLSHEVLYRTLAGMAAAGEIERADHEIRLIG